MYNDLKRLIVSIELLPLSVSSNGHLSPELQIDPRQSWIGGDVESPQCAGLVLTYL